MDAVPQGFAVPVRPEPAAPAQLRHHELDEVAGGVEAVVLAEVDAVDTDLVEPVLDRVSDLPGIADGEERTAGQVGQHVEQFADRLVRAERSAGSTPERVLPGDVAHERVTRVDRRVEAEPAVREAALHTGVPLVLSELRARLLLGRRDHDTGLDEELHVPGGPARGDRGRPYPGGDVPHRFGRTTAGEQGLGVPPGELDAARRGGRGDEERRPLPRRGGQVRPGHPEVLAHVVDVMHLRRIRVDAVLPVGDDRVLLPRALPQLVEHLQVLVGNVEALVVFDFAVQAEVAGRVGQVRGDDVPADPSLGQMVQRRHPAGERERRLVRRGEGDAEAQVPGDRGHGRHDEQRIVRRYLQPFADRGVGAAAECVVGAEHVREEDRVEPAALQQLGKLQPVLDVVEPLPVVAGQPPQPVGDVADAVHLEQVENQPLRLGHHATTAAAWPTRPELTSRPGMASSRRWV